MEEQRRGNSRAERQGGKDGCPRGEGEFVAAHQFLKPVEIAWWPGQHWLVIQKALDVKPQSVGGLISTRAIFFQRFHRDPIQIASQQMNELGRVGLTVFGRIGQLSVDHRAEARGRPLGLLFADGAPHLVQPGSDQGFRIKGRLAGEQFIKQHAQRVDVAAGINVQTAHLGLLRAHVSRGADELLERSEKGLIGEAYLVRIGDAEINDFRHRHAVV